MKRTKAEQFKSKVYTDRPPYADFDAPAKFTAIQSIIAKRLVQHPNAICSYSGGSDSDIMIDLIEQTRKLFEMPKAVLLSIKPKYCELIANGKKKIEVRKTRPKLEPPFKCYIYCTKDKHLSFWIGKIYNYADDRSHNLFDKCGNGKVIGEFVCDEIFPMSITYSDPNHRLAQREFPFTCLTDKEIMDYLGNGKRGCGWHISDLKIYDEPKELSEFYKIGALSYDDWLYGMYNGTTESTYEKYLRPFKLARPPQSWCYVEERENYAI